MEKSSAGRPPIKFAGQTVEIVHEPDTVKTGVDGHISRARHPSIIFWHGGASKSFANVTHVKIVADGGIVLIDDELTSTYNAPKDVSGGVKFEVLREG